MRLRVHLSMPVNLVLSPTRTYAPVIKKILDELRPEVHGMVHCTGGAQTKVLHPVGENCKVVKDNMFPVPPLFKAIHDCSETDWKEMYQVFNMGHRMEIYVRPEGCREGYRHQQELQHRCPGCGSHRGRQAQPDHQERIRNIQY